MTRQTREPLVADDAPARLAVLIDADNASATVVTGVAGRSG